MKYSAAILVALFGLAAASILHQQEDDVGRSELLHRHRNWNNDDVWNNDRNKNRNQDDNNNWNNNNNNDDKRNNRNRDRSNEDNNNWDNDDTWNNRNNNDNNNWNNDDKRNNRNKNRSNEDNNNWDNDDTWNNKRNKDCRNDNNNNCQNNDRRNKNRSDEDNNNWSNEHVNDNREQTSEVNGQSYFDSFFSRNWNNNKNKNWSNEDNDNNRNQKGNKNLLQKQKVILKLLTNLQQKNIDLNLAQVGNNFNPVDKINRFNNQQAVKKFLKNVQNNNFLPKDEVFSVTNQQHQNQAAQLFTFLYSAQDWDTLKQAAAWARDRFNTDQFAFVLTSVVMNHPTTQGVVIPALWEIIPHAFVPATTLQKIYKAKIQGLNDVTIRANYNNQNRNNNNYNTEGNDNTLNNDKNNDNNRVGTNNPNNIFADNDGSLNNNAGITENPENRLSYFTEDIGLNDLHARFHTQYPLFLGINKNKNYFTSNLDNTNKVNTINLNKQDIKRGEAFYFAHQQLLARYVLERLSNNLPIPRPININDKIKVGYNPNLVHANGQAVPARPPKTVVLQNKLEDNNNNNNALMPNNNQAQNAKIYEQRLQKVADSGIYLNVDGTKTRLNKNNAVGVLANLIAAPASSVNPDYYGDYFSTMKNAIGNVVDPNNQNKVAPGVISNYATAARDPAYYQLLMKLNQIFKNLQNKLGPYTKDQLNMQGVKIQNIDVTDLETELETVTINVNNVLPKNRNNNRQGNDNNNNNNNDVNDIINTNENFNVKFQRLTNKPFNIKLNILSNKNTNAIVRIFLGPKYDSNGQRFTLPQASQYFVQLDQFKVKLNNGENRIERNSRQTNVNVQNPVSIKQLLNRIEQGQLTINKGEHQVLGLPLRSQLPKGKRNGQQFVLYTIINSLDINNDNVNTDSLEQENSMEMDNMSLRHNNNNNNDNNNSDSNESLDNTNDDNINNNNNINNQILRKVRDNRSVGFPLDRPIVDVNYNTANQYFKTVTIYHKVKNDN